MNYPSGTIVQNYNVAAGRVIQLPCFMDQQEPPDGFRAIVFATPEISVDNPTAPNQVGPAFAAGAPGAVQFDLTQLIQQNQLSRARSILVTSVVSGTAAGGAFLLLDSGLMINLAGDSSAASSTGNNGSMVGDFISANPIFSLLVTKSGMTPGLDWQFTIAVANFKLSLAGYSAGVNGS